MGKMCIDRRRRAAAGFAAGLLLLSLAPAALASTTASLTVVTSGTASHNGTVTISFNGFSESLHSDSTSTANSMASAIAVKFSRDYLASGLCAAARGNVINFKLKTGTFSSITIAAPGSSFGFSHSGFLPGNAVHTITLSNIGNQPTAIQSIVIGGTNASDFSITGNNCPLSLFAGDFCAVTVTFTPTAPGARTAILVVSGSTSSSTITLLGAS